MGKLTQVMAAVRQGAAWLVPAERRDWAEAVWAEAHAVPPGLTRLAWRAGGVWVLAREALMPRRLGRAALSRRFFGPASPGRVARSMRFLCCAAVLVLVPAFTFLDAYNRLAPTRPALLNAYCGGQGCAGVVPGRSNGGPTWQAEILIMLLVTGYVGVTLFLTSRRAGLTRSTLVTGVGTGLLFGVVMFAVDPLGLDKLATNPWLPGSTADPLVVLAWILLFGGPAVAAVLAGWRCRGPGGARLPHNHRIGQGVAAGLLANGLAAMFTTVLGTGATLLVVRSPRLLHWITHGRHLTEVAAYRYQLNTGNHAGGYLLMLMFFPVIGLFVSYLAAAVTSPAPAIHDLPM